MVKRILYIVFPLLFLCGGYFWFFTKPEDTQKSNAVVVYTYSSFASSWGAGAQIKELFYKKTGIQVDFRDIGEAGVLLQRLMFEGAKTDADVVMGLDQFSVQEALEQQKWLQIDTLQREWNPELPKEDREVGPFLPYNWSPLTFIYRKSDMKSFRELKDLSGYKKIWSVLDPRTSSPGYIFFHWVLQKYGEQGSESFFHSTKDSILTISPSWSAAYGLFTKKQAQVVFSYLTSPAYHWIEEKNMEYQPMYLKDELPYQVEYMGILKNCKRCEAAIKFRDFILSPEAQKIILTKNYMFPVLDGIIQGTEFSKLQKVNLFKPTKKLTKEHVIQNWKKMNL